MHIKSIAISCLLLSLIVFNSCQKVIDVNLNSSAARYIIQGNITDKPGPYIVKITQSVNFADDNNFPGVSNAKVYITDVNAGITDTLIPVSAGIYRTHTVLGTPGHTYTLSAIVGNTTFTASSKMPPVVALDSVYTQKSIFGNDLNVVPVYNDPAGAGNYYHLLLTVKDSVAQEIYVHDDQINDGARVARTLRTDIDIIAGDSVAVELQCVDHDVFTYYANLEETIQQNSATPANPKSNITGGALGYFSAHTVSKLWYVAKE